MPPASREPVLEEILPHSGNRRGTGRRCPGLVEEVWRLWGRLWSTVPSLIVPAVAEWLWLGAGLMDSLSVVPAGMLINAIFRFRYELTPTTGHCVRTGSERSLAVTTATALFGLNVFGSNDSLHWQVVRVWDWAEDDRHDRYDSA